VDRGIYRAAGDRISQGDIALLIHGDARIRPVVTVSWILRALLVKSPTASCVSQLEPAYRSAYFSQSTANHETAY